VQIPDLDGDPIDEETVYDHALAEWGYRTQLYELSEDLGRLQLAVLAVLGDSAALGDDAALETDGGMPTLSARGELRNQAVRVGIMLGQLRQMWDINERYERQKRVDLTNLAFGLGLTDERVDRV